MIFFKFSNWPPSSYGNYLKPLLLSLSYQTFLKWLSSPILFICYSHHHLQTFATNFLPHWTHHASYTSKATRLKRIFRNGRKSSEKTCLMNANSCEFASIWMLAAFYRHSFVVFWFDNVISIIYCYILLQTLIWWAVLEKMLFCV